MDIRPFGRNHLLVEVDDARHALSLYEQARRQHVDASSIVPAARTVLFEGLRDLDALVRALPDWDLSPTDVTGDTVEVPTTYDGDDLDQVARLWDMSSDEVVATHTSTDFVVAFCGFAPGFAYCSGLPDDLAVPRLESPRTKVPAGSVGLAGTYTGVYPTSSPGGWQLVGRTDLVLWDVDRDPPATLVPGTRVRFTEVR
jgi:KipI family sensor histidine kinase inhibitor